jgi:hypothetical protein
VKESGREVGEKWERSGREVGEKWEKKWEKSGKKSGRKVDHLLSLSYKVVNL